VRSLRRVRGTADPDVTGPYQIHGRALIVWQSMIINQFVLLILHFLIYWNLALSFPTYVKTLLLLLSAQTFLHLIIIDGAIGSMM